MKLMKHYGIPLITMGLLLLPSTNSRADLIGDTVNVLSDTDFAGDPTNTSVIVRDGFELTEWGGDDTDGLFNIDIGSNTIFIEMTRYFGIGSTAFQGLRFSDLDWLPTGGTIIGVTATSPLGTVDQTRIEFGPNFINFDLQLLSTYTDGHGNYNAKDTMLLTLDVAPVPEPTTLAMWGMFGLIGGFVACRKRKRS